MASDFATNPTTTSTFDDVSYASILTDMVLEMDVLEALAECSSPQQGLSRFTKGSGEPGTRKADTTDMTILLLTLFWWRCPVGR